LMCLVALSNVILVLGMWPGVIWRNPF